MSVVNNIGALDGNVYLVRGRNDVNGATATDFDKIYNDITVDDSLESIFAGAAAEFNVDENFLKAVAQAESGFDTNAVSYCGAQGIMQLMPFTSESYGVTDPFDARQNIYAGAQLLSELLDNYNGNATLALAAYNAGSGSVQKYGGVPPYDETLNYINKINDILGGALSSDSTTVDGAAATDFTGTQNVDVPETSVNKEHNVQDNSKNSFGVYEERRTTDNSVLSYEDYLYVMNTYKEVLNKLFSAISADKDDNLSAELYNIITGSNSYRIENYGTDEFNNSVDDVIKPGIVYNVAEANVRLLNSSSYENVYKSDPQSIYQAQASMISPLVLKLLDL